MPGTTDTGALKFFEQQTDNIHMTTKQLIELLEDLDPSGIRKVVVGWREDMLEEVMHAEVHLPSDRPSRTVIWLS